MKQSLEKRYRLNLSWDYEHEEQWINKLSAEGLHLLKPGALKSTFARNSSVRYTYCLDYQPGLGTTGPAQEYFDLYGDAGWEYVTSYHGIWHYFRREWSPKSVQKLYTDRESLAGLYKKMQRIMAVVLLSNVTTFLVMMIGLINRWNELLWTVAIPVTVIYAFLFTLLGYGVVKTGRKIKEHIG